MSSRYQKIFSIPPGFPALLKNFSREILRQQPDNIYEFGSQYFAELLRESAGTMGAVASSQHHKISDMSQQELEDIVLQIFKEFDEDQSGFLDRQEFKKCLASARLGLTSREINTIMAEVDENEDGVIEYGEFMPLAIELLQSMQVSGEVAEASKQREAEALRQAEAILVKGMSKEQLDARLRAIFLKADRDGSNWLSRTEFRNALVNADLGLTRKDINLIMSAADVNQDGAIEYAEFVPVALAVLTERLAQDLVHEAAWSSEDALQRGLLEGFSRLDPEDSGHLPAKEVRAALMDMSYQWLGLSRLQLATIMALPQATPNADTGTIAYARLVPAAAEVIQRSMGMRSQTDRAMTVAAAAESHAMQEFADVDPQEAAGLLAQIFENADTDGRGVLSYVEAVDMLHALGTTELGLTPLQIQAIVQTVDADENGEIDWHEFVEFATDVLGHLAAQRETVASVLERYNIE